MAAIEFTQRSLSSAAMTILLLVAGAVCSSKADASCGDYVLSRHSVRFAQQAAGHGSETDSRIADSNRFMDLSGKSMPLSKPCSGPECGRSKLPVSPLPAMPFHGIRFNDSLMVSHAMRSPEPEMESRAVPSCDGHTQRGFPLLIEVPPEFVC